MLDVSIRLEVLDVIDQLRARFELAVLYITHDIASARYFAGETLVMYAGEIVERGPSEDLSQSPAHPYTQLLLAAAPDPDRLGAPIDERLGPRRETGGAASRPTLSVAASAPAARSPTTTAGLSHRPCERSMSIARRPAGDSTLQHQMLVQRQREERSVALPQ